MADYFGSDLSLEPVSNPEPQSSVASPYAADDAFENMLAPATFSTADATAAQQAYSHDVYVNVMGKQMRKDYLMASESGRKYLKLQELNATDRRGFLESATDYTAADVPFVGDVLNLRDTYKVADTLKAVMDGGDVEDGDLVNAAAFMENEQRKQQATWTGQAGDISRMMLPWMIEAGVYGAAVARGAKLGMPGVAASVVWTGGKKAVASAIGKRASGAAAKFLATQGGKYLDNIAFLSAKQVAGGTVQQVLDTGVDAAINIASGRSALASRDAGVERIGQVLAGEEINDARAEMLSLGREWVERMGEQQGPVINAALAPVGRAIRTAARGGVDLSKDAAEGLSNVLLRSVTKEYGTAKEIAKGAKAAAAAKLTRAETIAQNLSAADKSKLLNRGKVALMGAWLADKAADSLDKYPLEYMLNKLKAGAYDGFLAEMAEERWGGFVNGLLGFEGGDAGIQSALKNMWWDNSDQFKAEVLAFALPVAVVGAAQKGRLNLAGYDSTKFSKAVQTVAEGTTHTGTAKTWFEYSNGRAEDSDLAAVGTPQEVVGALKYLRTINETRPTGFFGRLFDYGITMTEMVASGSLAGHSRYNVADHVLARSGAPALSAAYSSVYNAAMARAERAYGVDTKEGAEKEEAQAKASAEADAYADRVLLDTLGNYRGTMVVQKDILSAANIDTKGLSEEEVTAKLNEVAAAENSPIVRHEIDADGHKQTVYSLRSESLDQNPVVQAMGNLTSVITDTLKKHGFKYQTLSVGSDATRVPKLSMDNDLGFTEKDLWAISQNPISLDGWRYAAIAGKSMLSSGATGFYDAVAQSASRLAEQISLKSSKIVEFGGRGDPAAPKFAISRSSDGGFDIKHANNEAWSQIRSASTPIGNAVAAAEARQKEMRSGMQARKDVVDPRKAAAQAETPYDYLRRQLSGILGGAREAQIEVKVSPFTLIEAPSALRMLEWAAALGQYGISDADLASARDSEINAAKLAQDRLSARKNAQTGMWTLSAEAVNSYNPVTHTATVYVAPDLATSSMSGYGAWEDMFEATLKAIAGSSKPAWSPATRAYFTNAIATINTLPDSHPLFKEAISLRSLLEDNNSIEATGKMYGTLRLGYSAPADAGYRGHITKLAAILKGVPGYAEFIRDIDLVHGAPFNVDSAEATAAALVPWRPYNMTVEEAMALYTHGDVAPKETAKVAKPAALKVASPDDDDNLDMGTGAPARRTISSKTIRPTSAAAVSTPVAAKPAAAPVTTPPVLSQDAAVAAVADVAAKDNGLVDDGMAALEAEFGEEAAETTAAKDPEPRSASLTSMRQAFSANPELFVGAYGLVVNTYGKEAAPGVFARWGMSRADIQDILKARKEQLASGTSGQDTGSADNSDEESEDGSPTDTSDDSAVPEGQIDLSSDDKIRKLLSSGPMSVYTQLAGLVLGRDGAVHALVDLMQVARFAGALPSFEALRSGQAIDTPFSSAKTLGGWVAGVDMNQLARDAGVLSSGSDLVHAARVMASLGNSAADTITHAMHASREVLTAEIVIAIDDKTGMPTGVERLRRHMDRPGRTLSRLAALAENAFSNEDSRTGIQNLLTYGRADSGTTLERAQRGIDLLELIGGRELAPLVLRLREMVTANTDLQGSLSALWFSGRKQLLPSLKNSTSTPGALVKVFPYGKREGGLRETRPIMVDILNIAEPARPSVTAHKPDGSMVYNVRLQSGFAQVMSDAAKDPRFEGVEIIELLGARFNAYSGDAVTNSVALADKDVDADMREIIMRAVYDQIVKRQYVQLDHSGGPKMADKYLYIPAMGEKTVMYGIMIPRRLVDTASVVPVEDVAALPDSFEAFDPLGGRGRVTLSREGSEWVSTTASGTRIRGIAADKVLGAFNNAQLPSFDGVEARMEQLFFDMLPSSWGDLNPVQVNKRMSAVGAGGIPSRPAIGGLERPSSIDADGTIKVKGDGVVSVFVADKSLGLDGETLTSEDRGRRLAVSSGAKYKKIHKAHTWFMDRTTGAVFFMKTKRRLGAVWGAGSYEASIAPELSNGAFGMEIDEFTDKDGVKIAAVPDSATPKLGSRTQFTLKLKDGAEIPGYVYYLPAESVIETTNLDKSSEAGALLTPKPAINDAASLPNAKTVLVDAVNLMPDTLQSVLDASGVNLVDLVGDLATVVKDDYMSDLLSKAKDARHLPQLIKPLTATIMSRIRELGLKMYQNGVSSKVAAPGGSMKTLSDAQAEGKTFDPKDPSQWHVQPDGTEVRRDPSGNVYQVTWTFGTKDQGLKPMRKHESGKLLAEAMRLNIRTSSKASHVLRFADTRLAGGLKLLDEYGQAMLDRRQALQDKDAALLGEAEGRLIDIEMRIVDGLTVSDPGSADTREWGRLTTKPPALSDLFDENFNLRLHAIELNDDGSVTLPGQTGATHRVPGGPSANRVFTTSGAVYYEADGLPGRRSVDKQHPDGLIFSGADMDGDSQTNMFHYFDEYGMKYSKAHLPATAEISAEAFRLRGDIPALRKYTEELLVIVNKVSANMQLDFEINSQENMDRDERQEPIDVHMLDDRMITAGQDLVDVKTGKVIMAAGSRQQLGAYKDLEAKQPTGSARNPAVRRTYEKRTRESSSSRGIGVWAYNGLQELVFLSGAHMVADMTLTSGPVAVKLDARKEGYSASYKPVRKALGNIINIIIDDLSHGKASYLHITEADLMPMISMLMLKRHADIQGLKDHFQSALDYMNTPLISALQSRLKRRFMKRYTSREDILASARKDSRLMQAAGYSKLAEFEDAIDKFALLLSVSDRLSATLSAQVLYHKRPATPARFAELYRTLATLSNESSGSVAQFFPGDSAAYRKSLTTARWLHEHVYAGTPWYSTGVFEMAAAIRYNKLGEINPKEDPVVSEVSAYQRETLGELMLDAAAIEPLAAMLPQDTLAKVAAKLKSGLVIAGGKDKTKMAAGSQAAPATLVNAIISAIYADYRSRSGVGRDIVRNKFLDNVYLQDASLKVVQDMNKQRIGTARLYSVINPTSMSTAELDAVRADFSALAEYNNGNPITIYGDIEIDPAHIPVYFMLASVQAYGQSISGTNGNLFQLFDPAMLDVYGEESKKFTMAVLESRDRELWDSYSVAFLDFVGKGEDKRFATRTRDGYGSGGSVLLRAAYGEPTSVATAKAIGRVSGMPSLGVTPAQRTAMMESAGTGPGAIKPVAKVAAPKTAAARTVRPSAAPAAPAPAAPAPSAPDRLTGVRAAAHKAVSPKDMSGHAAKDLAMFDVATQFIGKRSGNATVSSTAKYMAIWGALANTGNYTSTDVVMVSGSGPWRGVTAQQIQATFDSFYVPLLEKVKAAGAAVVVGGAQGTDILVRAWLIRNGFTRAGAAGFARFDAPAVSGAQAPAAPAAPAALSVTEALVAAGPEVARAVEIADQVEQAVVRDAVGKGTTPVSAVVDAEIAVPKSQAVALRELGVNEAEAKGEYELHVKLADHSWYRASNNKDGVVTHVQPMGSAVGDADEYRNARVFDTLVGKLRADIVSEASRFQETQKPRTEVQLLPSTIVPGKMVLGDGRVVDAHPDQERGIQAMMRAILAGGPSLTIITGGPGRGKTAIVKETMRRLRLIEFAPKVVIAAPTHQAANVAGMMGAFWRKLSNGAVIRDRAEKNTFAGFFGGRPDRPEKNGRPDMGYTPVADYWYPRPDLVPSWQGPLQSATAEVFLIDESSMLKREETEYLLAVQNARSVPVILIGDSDQIPAVDTRPNRKEVSAAESAALSLSRAERVELTQIMRQAAGNPLITVIERVRQAIRGTSAAAGTEGRANSALREAIPTEMTATGGVISVQGTPGVLAVLGKAITAELFRRDPLAFRFVAGTNARVRELNKLLFSKLFPSPDIKDATIARGAVVKAYSNFNGVQNSDHPIVSGVLAAFGDNLGLHHNSDDFIVGKISDKRRLGGPLAAIANLEGYLVELHSAVPGESVSVKPVTSMFLLANHNQDSIAKQLKAALDAMTAEKARLFKVGDKKAGWAMINAIDIAKHHITTFGSITKDGKNSVEESAYRGISKSWDLGYAMTVHKSQGSTFKAVAVDTPSITTRTKAGLWSKLQMLYVAMSRASSTAIMMADSVPSGSYTSEDAAVVQSILNKAETDTRPPEYVEDNAAYGSLPVAAAGLGKLTPFRRTDANQPEITAKDHTIDAPRMSDSDGIPMDSFELPMDLDPESGVPVEDLGADASDWVDVGVKTASLADARSFDQLVSWAGYRSAGIGDHRNKELTGRIRERLSELRPAMEGTTPYMDILRRLSAIVAFEGGVQLSPQRQLDFAKAVSRLRREEFERGLVEYAPAEQFTGTQEELERGADEAALEDLGFGDVAEELNQNLYNDAVADNRGNLIPSRLRRDGTEDLTEFQVSASLGNYRRAFDALRGGTLLGEGEGAKVHAIVNRELTFMQNYTARWQRELGYDQVYYATSGVVHELVDTEIEIMGKTEKGKARKVLSKFRKGVNMDAADHQDLLVAHNLVNAALLHVNTATYGAKPTYQELMDALTRARVHTGIEITNEALLRKLLPHHADAMIARVNAIRDRVAQENAPTEANMQAADKARAKVLDGKPLSAAERDAIEFVDTPVLERQDVQLTLAKDLYEAGVANYTEQTVKQRSGREFTIPTNIIWTVPGDIAYSQYYNSKDKEKASQAVKTLEAAGREYARLDPVYMLERARQRFYRMKEEINAQVPYVASEDGTLIHTRERYTPLTSGMLGFTGNVETAILDTMRITEDRVTRDALRRETEVLKLSTGKEGAPRPLEETTDRMLDYLFSLKGLEYTSRDAAMKRIASFETPDEVGANGLHAGMTFADVAIEINREIQKAMMARAMRGEDVNAPLARIADPAAVSKAISKQKFATREFSPRTLSRTFDTFEILYRMTGKLPKNIGVLDAQQKYVSDVATAAAQRAVMNSVALTMSPDGMPSVLFDPDLDFEGTVFESLLTTEVWEAQARALAAAFKDKVDNSVSARENVHRLIHRHVRGNKAYTEVESTYPSVAGMYAHTRGPAEENYLDLAFGGGEIGALLKHVTGSVADGPGDILRRAEAINNASKMMAMQASLFFFIAGLEGYVAGTGGRALLPGMTPFWKVREAIKARHPEVAHIINLFEEMGGTTGTMDDPIGLTRGIGKDVIAKLETYTRQRFGAESASWLKHLAGTSGAYTDTMFDSWLNSAKVTMFIAKYVQEERKALEEGRKFNPRKDLAWYVRYLDEEMGGFRAFKYSWFTPTARRLSNLLMFSYPWTIAAWNASGGGLLTAPLLKNYLSPEEAKFILWKRIPIMWLGILHVLPAVVQMAAYVMGGGGPDDDDELFIWNNEEGRERHADITPLLRKFSPTYEGDPTGKRRFYIRWGKQLYEVSRWFEDPAASFSGKLSMGARWAWEQATGTAAGIGWDMPFKDQGLIGLVADKDGSFAGSRVGHTMAKFLPFSVMAWARTPDAAPWQLIGPISKGISYSRAVESYEGLLKTWANKDTYSKAYSSPKIQANLEALGAGILDAAERNGYNAEKVLETARGTVAKDIYADLYDALNNSNVVAAEDAARRLHRLNAKASNALASIKGRNRVRNLPAKLTPEQQAIFDEAFKKP